MILGIGSELTLGAARALEVQGFLDTAQELLKQHDRSSAARSLPAAEAGLRLALAQVRALCLTLTIMQKQKGT